MYTTAGLITIGDELLVGQVENTNASWLGARLTERGVDIREIRVVPDERPAIEAAVSGLGRAYTHILTTGGLGSTPDDITLESVAAALGRSLAPNKEARRLVEASVAEIREDHPDFDHDVDAANQYPEGARIVPNEEGISPGCVCGNVYVLPGIPAEMRATFDAVAHEFDGDVDSLSLYTETPESHLTSVLDAVKTRFGIRIGCYPDGECKRIRLVSDDAAVLSDAAAWLSRHPRIRLEE